MIQYVFPENSPRNLRVVKRSIVEYLRTCGYLPEAHLEAAVHVYRQELTSADEKAHRAISEAQARARAIMASAKVKAEAIVKEHLKESMSHHLSSRSLARRISERLTAASPEAAQKISGGRSMPASQPTTTTEAEQNSRVHANIEFTLQPASTDDTAIQDVTAQIPEFYGECSGEPRWAAKFPLAVNTAGTTQDHEQGMFLTGTKPTSAPGPEPHD